MSLSSNKYLIIITGPTAIGKTDLAIKLNQELGTSLISADSRQIYKELSIGTAKPSKEEIDQGNIKIVDHVSLHQNYSVGHFEKEAIEVINQDHEKGNLSMICGGTGLYIKAVTQGLNAFPDVSEEIKNSKIEKFKTEGIESIQKELEIEDPEYYKLVDLNNAQRIIRALSVIEATGKPFSDYLEPDLKKRNFKCINIILNQERNQLYTKINKRVIKMIERGLIEEVESLISYRDLNALNTVGYKEVFQYLDDDISKEECIEEIQKNTRRYAKRQLTWLRKYNNGHEFLAEQYQEIRDYINSSLQER